MIQAVVVVISVWYFSFWVSRRVFKIDQEMSMLLSARCHLRGLGRYCHERGYQGEPKKLSFVISLVLIVAIPMMYLLPYLSKWIGLSEEVAGAWLWYHRYYGGGSRSGSHGETAEQYSVSSSQAKRALGVARS